MEQLIMLDLRAPNVLDPPDVTQGKINSYKGKANAL